MSNKNNFTPPKTQKELLDLCKHFESVAVNRLLYEPKLKAALAKQRGLIEQQKKTGDLKLDPALEKGPLPLFQAELFAMALTNALPDESDAMVYKEHKNAATSDAFAKCGAPALAKIFKP